MHTAPKTTRAAALMREALRRLSRRYGKPAWSPRGRPLDVLVEMMLSQNTSWSNAAEGYRRLKRDLPTWERALAAPVDEVQRSIAVCGLGRMRARRLQALLARLKAERGRLTLSFVGRMSPSEATAYLSSYHGIGPKTVACTLLFGFGMPVFPVDNGILRVARRLRVVRTKAREAEVEAALERHTRPQDRYPLHVLMYRHAKETCRPKNPLCDECVLLSLCPTGQRRLRHAPPPEPATNPKRPRLLSLFISAGLAKDADRPPRRGRQ